MNIVKIQKSSFTMLPKSSAMWDALNLGDVTSSIVHAWSPDTCYLHSFLWHYPEGNTTGPCDKNQYQRIIAWYRQAASPNKDNE